MSALKFLYREVECEHGCSDVSSECIGDYEVICDHYECEKTSIITTERSPKTILIPTASCIHANYRYIYKGIIANEFECKLCGDIIYLTIESDTYECEKLYIDGVDMDGIFKG